MRKRTEDGATATEYGLLITGIAIVIATTVFAFGDAVSALFESFPFWPNS